MSVFYIFKQFYVPEDDETEVAFDLDELKALAMAAIATAATAFPDPGGTGIKGGGTGKCVKAWLLAEVAEDGVRLKDEFRGPKAVTMGLEQKSNIIIDVIFDQYTV